MFDSMLRNSQSKLFHVRISGANCHLRIINIILYNWSLICFITWQLLLTFFFILRLIPVLIIILRLSPICPLLGDGEATAKGSGKPDQKYY